MNYEKKVMESAYEILKKGDFVWSTEFKDEMKHQLLDLLLDYFTDIEHYEKCAFIHKLSIKLENKNENISERIITGSTKC
jgi:hypothetical protein